MKIQLPLPPRAPLLPVLGQGTETAWAGRLSKDIVLSDGNVEEGEEDVEEEVEDKGEETAVVSIGEEAVVDCVAWFALMTAITVKVEIASLTGSQLFAIVEMCFDKSISCFSLDSE